MKRNNILLVSIFGLFFFTPSLRILSQYHLIKISEKRDAENIAKANIQSMTKYLLNSPSGNKDGNRQKVLFNEFDSTGHCIHWIRFLPNGDSIEERNTILLDEKGRLKELIAKGTDGTLDNRIVSIYDSLGREVETNKILPDGSNAFKWLHIYDDKDRETESITYKEKDTVKFRQIFKYDDKNHTIETVFMRDNTATYRTLKNIGNNGYVLWEKQFTPEGTLTRREENKFDRTGNRINNSVFNSKGKLISKSDFMYDQFGNLTGEITYNALKNSTIRTIYEYTFR